MLDDMGLRHRVSLVRDCEEAIRLLTRTGPYLTAPAPDLVFVDINLPKLTGMEVLDKLGELRDRLPLCILTGSVMEREIAIAKFKFHGECYMIKPVDTENMLDAFACFAHLKPIAEAWRNQHRASAAF